MKILSTYSDNADFNRNKSNLEETYEDYIALAVKEQDIHLKEIPDLLDIALWDNTNEELVMVHAWEYTLDDFPKEKYMPIGVEIIPKSHMTDGHARLISLSYMRCDTPKVGGNKQNICIGLGNERVEGIGYKNYFPNIKENNSWEFGDVQEIKEWSPMGNFCQVPTDKNHTKMNPFTINQGYYFAGSETKVFPSPYTKSMAKNSIFFSENTDINHPSVLLDFDGKGTNNKILNHIYNNLGNDDWKSGTTVDNISGSTNAPSCQCCWMYCVKEGYETNSIFGQGCWYQPTFAELCYLIARLVAYNNTISTLNSIYGENIGYYMGEKDFISGLLNSISFTNYNTIIHFNLLTCCPNANVTTDKFHETRAYLMV